MNKKLLIILAVLIILIPQVTSNDLSDKIDSEIIEEFKTEDTVSIIVVLDETAEINVNDQTIEIKDDDWKTFDNEIENVDVNYEYSAVMNGFAAEVNEQALEELEQDENVEKILYDHIYELALDTSVPLVSADDVQALQLNGIDLTGVGQTICVIDTGINYNHADLGSCLGDGCKVVSGQDIYNNDMNPLDDHGHGSHVAGIAAANGDITGIAPGASLIAMKVFGSDRSTGASQVLAGIDWCVNNATEFNISVITMSLSLVSGGNEIIFTSNSVCDAYSDGGVVNASNSAAAQGLFVSAAAGNDGDITGIGSPACGSNVTSVGGVDDSDTVNYNRGSILDLLAPGRYINSTYTSGYVEMSGTSMATPHVAGAAAILKQIATIEGATVTTQQIENALKEHGDLVADTDNGGSDLSYPRINVLAAANYFIYPNLTYSENIADGSILEPNTATLTFTATDISGINTFWYNSIAANVYDAYNTSTSWFVDVNWTAGEYNLTFYVNDSINNIANTTLTLFVDSAPTIDDWVWNNGTGTSTTSTNITIIENDTLTILVNVTDLDVYNNLNYSWLLDDVEINTTEDLVYTLGLQSAGIHTISLNVSDELNQSSTQNWNLTVLDVAAPFWSTMANDTADETDWTYNVSPYVNNSDGDTLAYSMSINLSDFTISSLGIIDGEFSCLTSGEYDVNVTVSDSTTAVLSGFFVTVEDTCTPGSDDDDDDDSGSGSGTGSGSSGGTFDGDEDEDEDTTTDDTTTEDEADSTEEAESTADTTEETNSTEETTDEDTSDYPLGAFGASLGDFDFSNLGKNQQTATAIVVIGIVCAACFGLLNNKNKKRGYKLNFGSFDLSLSGNHKKHK